MYAALRLFRCLLLSYQAWSKYHGPVAAIRLKALQAALKSDPRTPFLERFERELLSRGEVLLPNAGALSLRKMQADHPDPTSNTAPFINWDGFYNANEEELAKLVGKLSKSDDDNVQEEPSLMDIWTKKKGAALRKVSNEDAVKRAVAFNGLHDRSSCDKCKSSGHLSSIGTPLTMYGQSGVRAIS